MDGVKEENVRIDDIRDVVRRKLLSNNPVEILEAGVVIVYTIIIPNTLDAGFANANEAFSQVKQQLAVAASTGEFTAKLQTIAQELGVTILANVVAGDVAVSDPVIITVAVEEKDDSDKKELNDGEIAGIVIGCTFFVAIIVGLGYYYYKNGWNKKGSNKIRPDGAPVMAAIVPGHSNASITPINDDDSNMKVAKMRSDSMTV